LGDRPATWANLRRRVLFGTTLAVPLGLLVYVGGPAFFLAAAAVALLALREYFGLVQRRWAPVPQPLRALGFAFLLAFLWARGGQVLVAQALPPQLRPWLAPRVELEPGPVAAAVMLSLVVLLFERRRGRRLTVWALTLAGVFYIGWLAGYLQLLRALGPAESEAGRGWVLYVVAATWLYDGGAYVVGSAIGHHRVIPWVSPGKTWEGVAGGLVAAALVTWLAILPLPAAALPWPLAACAPLPIPPLHVLPLALAVSLAAQLGDLAESMIKRDVGAKDSSNLIPGQGGVLDRVDSLLFSVVPVYYYATLVARIASPVTG
jgi:phosphatidate cytidylyltransferase